MTWHEWNYSPTQEILQYRLLVPFPCDENQEFFLNHTSSFPGDVPTMRELECLRSKDGSTKVKVIQEVAAIWGKVATLLDINSSVIEQLECDHRRVADACREMFKKRLEDDEEFHEPLTWKMVIAVLRDCDLNVCANELQTLLTEGAM